MSTLDDDIARKLAEAAASGELASARGYGKPFDVDEGWQQTPEAWRLPFKFLKDAGFVPHEVELLKQRAQLRRLLDDTLPEQQKDRLVARLRRLERVIALRMESVRR